VPSHIFAIVPDRPFLATLARGLLGMAAGDPLRLARMTVLLPTPRHPGLARGLSAPSGEEGGPVRRCCCRGCARSATSKPTKLPLGPARAA
jgi:hypothetical protein